jgi:acyl phosphate:glycerol-3-phosphate acyltransferase
VTGPIARSLPALVIVAGYLVGGVPFGLILGRWAGGLDVRSVGSGNIGATNVARSLGAWAGVVTLALDVGKGAAVAWGAWRLTQQPKVAMAAGLAAIAGHVFPIYLGFRGGKGVATGLGVFLVLDPVATVGAGAVFLAAVAVSRRISVGSILSAASLPACLALRGAEPALLLAGVLAAALIVYRHEGNIRRLLSGTEPRMGAGR